jgi:hypothetical protein
MSDVSALVESTSPLPPISFVARSSKFVIDTTAVFLSPYLFVLKQAVAYPLIYKLFLCPI